MKEHETAAAETIVTTTELRLSRKPSVDMSDPNFRQNPYCRLQFCSPSWRLWYWVGSIRSERWKFATFWSNWAVPISHLRLHMAVLQSFLIVRPSCWLRWFVKFFILHASSSFPVILFSIPSSCYDTQNSGHFQESAVQLKLELSRMLHFAVCLYLLLRSTSICKPQCCFHTFISPTDSGKFAADQLLILFWAFFPCLIMCFSSIKLTRALVNAFQNSSQSRRHDLLNVAQSAGGSIITVENKARF